VAANDVESGRPGLYIYREGQSICGLFYGDHD
jgi:hypothetical protein